jgi:uncharacterized membrane protein
MRLAALLALLAAPLSAQDLPALFNVTGVAAHDTLNVRTEADVRSQVLHELEHDARDIEIVRLSENERWGRINIFDQPGWVSMTFLSPQARAKQMKQKLYCGGSEPFWSITLDAAMTYDPMDGPAFSFAVAQRTRSINRSDRYALSGRQGEDTATAIIMRRQCSDGMSETDFGISIDLLTTIEGKNSFLSGCCRLLP